jgi:hypothetical protein
MQIDLQEARSYKGIRYPAHIRFCNGECMLICQTISAIISSVACSLDRSRVEHGCTHSPGGPRKGGQRVVRNVAYSLIKDLFT